MERLGNDHFIALRSLAKSRWVQGQQFEWKFPSTAQAPPCGAEAVEGRVNRPRE